MTPLNHVRSTAEAQRKPGPAATGQPPAWEPFKPVQDPDLIFYPEPHDYWHRGHYVPNSISAIADAGKDWSFAKPEDIERGLKLHYLLLERFLMGKSFDPGEYEPWITPFVESKFWDTWQPVAVEHRMIDTRYMIAGTADVIMQNKKNGIVAIADLKTLSEKGRKRDIRAQLGGYMLLLWRTHPGLELPMCYGLWSSPGKFEQTTYNGFDCQTAFEAARSLWRQNKFDPFKDTQNEK